MAPFSVNHDDVQKETWAVQTGEPNTLLAFSCQRFSPQGQESFHKSCIAGWLASNSASKLFLLSRLSNKVLTFSVNFDNLFICSQFTLHYQTVNNNFYQKFESTIYELSEKACQKKTYEIQKVPPNTYHDKSWHSEAVYCPPDLCLRGKVQNNRAQTLSGT